MSDDKKWESIFDPSKKVNAANLITESLMVNYLRWQKLPLPRSPFWQKAISEKSDTLKNLRKRYVAEISYVQQLLKTYHYAPLAKFVKTSGAVGFRMVKKETRDKLLTKLDLFVKKYEQAGTISEAKIQEAMAVPEFVCVNKVSINKMDTGLADL